jgi:DNA-binding transcriptional ArsR family regulator
MYCEGVPRAATSSDVFNAVGDASRRSLLDALATADATVGELVDRLHLAQPVVSKHLRVLRDVGLVRCRSHGRHRTYRIDATALVPLHAWLQQLTVAVNDHYDRLDSYLDELQGHPEPGNETEQP